MSSFQRQMATLARKERGYEQFQPSRMSVGGWVKILIDEIDGLHALGHVVDASNGDTVGQHFSLHAGVGFVRRSHADLLSKIQTGAVVTVEARRQPRSVLGFLPEIVEVENAPES